jgi:peroxiredoxin Q/BCP
MNTQRLLCCIAFEESIITESSEIFSQLCMLFRERLYMRTEACAFRDSYKVFKDAGTEVIGVSSDSVESHQQFAAKHHLPFPLLSDVEGTIRKYYGVPTAFGLPGRVTYIIDRQGIVSHIFFSQFTSEKHVTQALQALRLLNEGQE